MRASTLRGFFAVAIAFSVVRTVCLAGTAPDFFALRGAWARDLHEQLVVASANLYAPGGAFVTGDSQRIVGRNAILSLYRGITRAFRGAIAFDSLSTAVSGNLAYDTGTFAENLTSTATGKTQHLTGTYLTLYRYSSGRWLIVEQVWTGREPSH